MTFEEEFPSLKDKKIYSEKTRIVDLGLDECGHIEQRNTYLFHEDDILKHCLDRQRVREAVRKLKDVELALIDFERELGL